VATHRDAIPFKALQRCGAGDVQKAPWRKSYHPRAETSAPRVDLLLHSRSLHR